MACHNYINGGRPHNTSPQMITFTSQSTFHSVTSNGVTLGKLYVTRQAAEAAAASLNKEWNGERTFGVKTWQQETFTAHEA